MRTCNSQGWHRQPLPCLLVFATTAKFVSETLLGYEAGYRKLVTSSFYVDVAAFHNKYNDLFSYGDESISTVTIAASALHSHFTLALSTALWASTNGVEISPDWKATHWMELKATYSYVSLNLEDKPTHTKTSQVSSSTRDRARTMRQLHSCCSICPKDLSLIRPTAMWARCRPWL